MKKNFFYFVCLVLVCSLFLSGRPIEKPTMQNTIQSPVGRNIVDFSQFKIVEPEYITLELGNKFAISCVTKHRGFFPRVYTVGYIRNGYPPIIGPGWCEIRIYSYDDTTVIDVTIASVSFEHEGTYIIEVEQDGVNIYRRILYLEVVQPYH